MVTEAPAASVEVTWTAKTAGGGGEEGAGGDGPGVSSSRVDGVASSTSLPPPPETVGSWRSTSTPYDGLSGRLAAAWSRPLSVRYCST